MVKKSQPYLAEVQSAFEAWRQSGRRPRITPPALRAQAVGLLAEYRLREVRKVLHVDHRRLSRWRREGLASESALADNDFVELPAAPTATRPAVVSLTLTRQALDGSVISISGALSEAQWRWALGLLRGRDHDSVDS